MSAARFVADSSLSLVARRLRLLGYDVEVVPGARLEELLEVAEREKRTALTLSSRHPRRFARVAVVHLRRRDPAESVRTIASRFEPSGIPFSRCTECNTVLESRAPSEAIGKVPGAVLRRIHSYAHCPACSRWYWEGSHAARLRKWIEMALRTST